MLRAFLRLAPTSFGGPVAHVRSFRTEFVARRGRLDDRGPGDLVALRRREPVRAAMAGVTAGVVGILLSALYDPVWTSAILRRADFGPGPANFGLRVWGRRSPVRVVAFDAPGGWLLG